jgi:hypothetical protein
MPTFQTLLRPWLNACGDETPARQHAPSATRLSAPFHIAHYPLSRRSTCAAYSRSFKRTSSEPVKARILLRRVRHALARTAVGQIEPQAACSRTCRRASALPQKADHIPAPALFVDLAAADPSCNARATHTPPCLTHLPIRLGVTINGCEQAQQDALIPTRSPHRRGLEVRAGW